MSLFSVFDPKTSFGISLNWCSSMAWLFLMQPSYWAHPNSTACVFTSFKKVIISELGAILNKISSPGLSFLPITMFYYIIVNNLLGLLPYSFTSSSHLTFTMTLALPLWFGHMLMGMVKVPFLMLAHLVPLSTPPILMPFMVMIELVSSVIRPLTLSIRLSANMVAGHLLLSLLSSAAPPLGVSMLSSLLAFLLMLTMLEVAVSVIQAYVFSVLSSLYFNEVNSPLLS